MCLVFGSFHLVLGSWFFVCKKHKQPSANPQTQSPSRTCPFPEAIPPVLPFIQPMSHKILSPVEMLRERNRLRSLGLRLVFTNGVFDLLHVGHVRYLAAARALGDALVVAINSDRTTRKLKGPERPITSENERAEILAALRHVNFVTVFDDVSPRALITQLLPDVLVKGGDYGLDEIHGREEVEAAGGKVVSLPFVAGASTTGLIHRVRML